MKHVIVLHDGHPRRQSRYRAVFVPLVVPVPPAIFLLGIFTLPRLVDAVIEYIHLSIGIAHLWLLPDADAGGGILTSPTRAVNGWRDHQRRGMRVGMARAS